MFGRLKSYLQTTTHDDGESHAYLIIPDLHGIHSIYLQVEKYIKKCASNRHIIFLGDYMDRGESGEIDGVYFRDAGSARIMMDLIKLQVWADKEGRKISFLRGNHETFFEDYYLHDNPYAYDKYGFFKDSVDCLTHLFEKDREFYEHFILFLKNLQAYHLEEKYNFLFIHAGIDPNETSLKKQAADGLIYWIRDQFIFSQKPLPYTVVFGHTPFSKPFIRKDKIGLDSGVYKRSFINLLKIDHAKHEIITLQKSK